MSTDNKLESRINDLEIQVSFQEQTIQQLNDALAEQQTQLLAVREVMQLMQTKMASLADAVDSSRATHDGHEAPPHY